MTYSLGDSLNLSIGATFTEGVGQEAGDLEKYGLRASFRE